MTLILARAVGVPVGRRSGGRLATTLVATKNVIIFFFFSPPSLPFLIEGVLGSKNLFSESCSEWPITYVYTPFQTPSAILWPPGGHFGFFEGATMFS